MNIVSFARDLDNLTKYVNELEKTKKSSAPTNRNVQGVALRFLNLLRTKNTSQKMYLYTYVLDPNEAQRAIHDFNAAVETVRKGGGFKRLWGRSVTEEYLSLVQKVLKNALPAAPKNSKYENQLVICGNDTFSGPLIQFKALMKGQKSSFIMMDDSEKLVECLRQVNHHWRIYITGHGSNENPNNIYFSKDPDSKSYSVDDLVTMLTTHAPQLKMKEEDLPSGRRIKISLQVCGGADESVDPYSYHATSFAENLGRALCKAGIPAEVMGRTGITLMDVDNNLKIRRLVDGKHKESGSKKSFIYKKDDNENIVGCTSDVYYKYDKKKL